MNFNRQQTIAVGVLLIALGLIAWLNLWWLILPGAFVTAGVIGYSQRRRIGRPQEAVQVGLWSIGLALVFLMHFWVGVLFLAGASILLRGRENQVEEWIDRTFRQTASRRTTTIQSYPTQHVPITTQSTSTPSLSDDATTPTTGETKRL